MSENEKQDLISEIHSVREDISNVSRKLSDLDGEIAEIDSSLVILPSRLQDLRQRGYIFLRYLDKSLDSLSSGWREVASSTRQTIESLKRSYQPEVKNLRAEIEELERRIQRSSVGSIHRYERLINSLSSKTSVLEDNVEQNTQDLEKTLGRFTERISSIQRDVSIVEGTLQLTSEASFKLRKREHPLLALKAKYLAEEGKEGVFLLTDQRFVFEGERDVVLEKLWIFTTKKRKERFGIAEAPIGSISEIVKGRVGLIEWTGIYVRFKPETGWADMPFDVKRDEADTIVRFFNYLSDGDADLDKIDLEGKTTQNRITTPTVVRCRYCGAPYSREIYRGQVSLICEYCGSSISLR
jgi:predicted  nucleic acid-binding Zn-ribbon protein